jgi:hypothetical protein
MAKEKLKPKPLNLKSEYYAELEKTLTLNISSVINYLGLNWLQHWAPISFTDLTTADQIAARKNNFELIALGQLFTYNLNHPEDPNVPYSPGINYWSDNNDGTQSYHLFLSPPAAHPGNGGGGGAKGNGTIGHSGGNANVTPPAPPQPKPPY